MYERIFNFNPGPAVMPESVLEQARDEMFNFKGTGMSVMEMSHRSKSFETILSNTEARFRELMGVSPDYTILFLQGGASLQFSMVPMNLRHSGSADYVLTGYWANKAYKEAGKLGKTRAVASSESTCFDRVPDVPIENLDASAAFLHFTSNETIHGIRWSVEPSTLKEVPLVCDMSSDMASVQIDVTKYGLIYAGAQKNLGPAGVTVVVVRNDLLERSSEFLPSVLNYKLIASKNSMYNTPPTYGIYMVGLVLNWLVENGGLRSIGERNKIKADLVYQAIDDSGGFYKGRAVPQDRSLMNATFTLPSEELIQKFVQESTKEGLIGLKGHKAIGGIRASLYNALPMEAVQALVQFMKEFQRSNG